MMMMMMTILV